jgi:hypothetical protein
MLLGMAELDDYTNIHEAAKQLGIREESLRPISRIGTLPAEKTAGQWFIPKEDLPCFLLSMMRGQVKENE